MQNVPRSPNRAGPDAPRPRADAEARRYRGEDPGAADAAAAGNKSTGPIKSYRELRVYQSALDAAMRVFELSKEFPAEERLSMTDPMRRAARSVCTNLGEAWRRRRAQAHFVSKLNDSESGAEETRVWLEFAARCRYVRGDQAAELEDLYDKILGQLVRMISDPTPWLLR